MIAVGYDGLVFLKKEGDKWHRMTFNSNAEFYGVYGFAPTIFIWLVRKVLFFIIMVLILLRCLLKRWNFFLMSGGLPPGKGFCSW
ncbi:MAG: hypothetical protein CM1200mP16_03430 [Nitrospina sp.]|nr:MAG: hypothetical protein CM1200mP16_03430 [Nitrospina sp.]